MLRKSVLLGVGIAQRLRFALMPNAQRLKREAACWASVDIDRHRRTSWDSIECLGRMAVIEMTGGRWKELMDVIINTIAPSDPSRLRGLTLGCGDMEGERWYFTHPTLPFEQVDAYDISAEVMQRAQRLTDSLGLNVQYHVGDVNAIDLSPATYDLVVVAHSMHHFREIDRIVDQISRSLTPGGVFVMWDYVGPRYQRFTRRQRAWANRVLQILPPKYRHLPDGTMSHRVENQPLLLLSPDEAPRSDRILPAVRRMNVRYQYNWAGLLYPLLRGGRAVNFNQDDPEDRRIVECLFQLDRLLCQSGQIEPNFTITIATCTNAS